MEIFPNILEICYICCMLFIIFWMFEIASENKALRSFIYPACEVRTLAQHPPLGLSGWSDGSTVPWELCQGWEVVLSCGADPAENHPSGLLLPLFNLGNHLTLLEGWDFPGSSHTALLTVIGTLTKWAKLYLPYWFLVTVTSRLKEL